MHALLSFSANHLAWDRVSNETKQLQIHYGGLALGGLHEAISSFSHANADAVLAASLLMLWQATDLYVQIFPSEMPVELTLCQAELVLSERWNPICKLTRHRDARSITHCKKTGFGSDALVEA